MDKCTPPTNTISGSGNLASAKPMKYLEMKKKRISVG